MYKRSISVFLLAAAAATFAACGKEKAGNSVRPAANEIGDVAVTTVTRSSIEDFYEATGTVNAKTTTQISANILGRIISLPVSEGDRVSRGQLLVRIDNSEAKTRLQQAESGLKEARAAEVEVEKNADAARAGVRTAEVNKLLAEKTFARYKELFSRRSVSAQEYDEVKAKLDAAASELERAKASVQAILSKKQQVDAQIERAKADIASVRVVEGYSRIVSPVAGVVVKKFAEAGGTAAPGAPLLSIEDNSSYLLEANVEESRSRSVRTGQRVSVRIDALGGGDFLGTVSEILPTADQASRSFVVKVLLEPNSLLRSGLFGTARFPMAAKDAFTVPASAIIQHRQLAGVFVVDDNGIANFRIITTGKSADGSIEVLSGLSEGDRVATSNVERITDGAKVK